MGDQIPHRLPLSFFLIAAFFGVHFCMQIPGTYLHHTVSMVGVTDLGISRACGVRFLFIKKNRPRNTPCQVWDRIWNPRQISV
jgi:hypothetical protein